jgi:energy-coupling factor transport system substrate-specific component
MRFSLLKSILYGARAAFFRRHAAEADPEKEWEESKMKNTPVRTIVAIGIGAALFFVLGRFVAIPSPVPDTNISIQYGLLAFMAAAFGPLAGLLIGLVGHALIDFSYGWGIWWSWVFASAIFGLLMGLGCGKMGLSDGTFGKKQIIRFNVTQVVAHLIAWGVVAPVLDILMYAEPANKVFLQGLVAGVINIVATAVVGTLLCVSYAATKPKKGSLNKE